MQDVNPPFKGCHMPYYFIQYVVRNTQEKYAQQVRKIHPQSNQSISPHSMRSIGMRLLQGGVSFTQATIMERK